jgi:anti-anti-sigma factor
MYLWVSVRTADRGTVADVAGEIDLYSSRWLHGCLRRFRPASGTRLVIDLSRVTFIDCSGLRMLLAACEDANRRGCRAGFSALSAAVVRAAELGGMRGEIPLAEPPAAPGSPPSALVFCALPLPLGTRVTSG